MDWLREFAGRRVTLMGLGRFGGGVGAARFLARRGAVVTVTDLAPEQALVESIQQLEHAAIARFRLGEHYPEDFESAELIVASPAVLPGNRFLEIARQHGVPVVTELSLFVANCPATIVGVTGSYGKSTTAALLAAVLTQSHRSTGFRRCWLGGNIGGSLLDDVEQMQSDDVVVLELSSAQLHYLDELQWSPAGALVTSFSPNHLDWHRTTDAYRRAKQSILRWQKPADFAILNGMAAEPGDWETLGQCSRVVEPHRASGETPLVGPHFAIDASLAILAAEKLGVTADDISAGLRSFRGLRHRLEFVGEHRGKRFFNDSKATTPEASIAALNAFDSPVLLLAGGSSKGVDLRQFAEVIHQRTSAVALMGETADELRCHLQKRREQHGPGAKVFSSQSLREAFQWLASQSRSGDVILLSPGCASFDWFRNYEDRGDQFCRLVEQFATTKVPN
ncbi:MAG: UDP-N-acetylmuramoyl-L-alanine--D-glutamate ligase [Planctomycetaceae bacterium]